MIIVRIVGGLGNQLFQYAAGRALSAIHHTELKLDVSGLEADRLRDFELKKFSTVFTLATQEEISTLKAQSSLSRVQQRLTAYKRKRFYKQPFFHFDKRFFQLGNDVYLQGYFQSEKYFQMVANELKEELYLRDVPADLLGFSAQLQKTNSVAIHFRQGDYANPSITKVHGILPVTYAQNAIQFIRSRIENPTFYLFSDEPEMAEKKLDLPNLVPVSGKISKNHLHDFFLMSQCKHNIIANSSFSWWAAWLNINPEKIVIAPNKWFNKGPKDTQDLIPAGWIRL